jgi:hypothetical protein
VTPRAFHARGAPISFVNLDQREGEYHSIPNESECEGSCGDPDRWALPEDQSPASDFPVSFLLFARPRKPPVKNKQRYLLRCLVDSFYFEKKKLTKQRKSILCVVPITIQLAIH